jgi:hypothetical protein
MLTPKSFGCHFSKKSFNYHPQTKFVILFKRPALILGGVWLKPANPAVSSGLSVLLAIVGLAVNSEDFAEPQGRMDGSRVDR